MSIVLVTFKKNIGLTFDKDMKKLEELVVGDEEQFEDNNW